MLLGQVWNLAPADWGCAWPLVLQAYIFLLGNEWKFIKQQASITRIFPKGEPIQETDIGPIS